MNDLGFFACNIYADTCIYMCVMHFYCRSEINYLMDLADTNRDGLLDYQEFTERFYQPTHTLGMNIYYHIMACTL